MQKKFFDFNIYLKNISKKEKFKILKINIQL